jgi:hypothetical protein
VGAAVQSLHTLDTDLEIFTPKAVMCLTD